MPKIPRGKSCISLILDTSLANHLKDSVPWGLRNEFLAMLIKTFLTAIEDKDSREKIFAMLLSKKLNSDELKTILSNARISSGDSNGPETELPRT